MIGTVPRLVIACLTLAVCAAACGGRPAAPAPWEAANPLSPVPDPPLGLEMYFSELERPDPAQIRLGRWLFFDRRLSVDGTVACATCHRPEHAFSEPQAVSIGINGQKGVRKAPSFVNQAVTLFPHFFWDGRAASLEEQALGPIENPVEMGNTAEAMVAALRGIPGYAPYFAEAFGTPDITRERVAAAIAAYERTRMSGNSPMDRWRLNRDAAAVPDAAKRGYDLFFDKARCSQCHVGSTFTDSRFHNVGVGWDARTGRFADDGRSLVTGLPADRGAFKTPTLRDVTRHPPYMHDGSMATLREVVEHYSRGGVPNPFLSPKIEPLGLTPAEVDALVSFLESLEGEGYQDQAPAAFPR